MTYTYTEAEKMENLNFKEAMDAGAAMVEIKEVLGVPVAVVPDGYDLKTLEHLLSRERPTRAKGTHKILDAESFIRFVSPYAEQGHAVDLYYHIEPSPIFTAVLNAARPGTPSHEDHQAIYAAPMSKEWETWTQADGVKMDQVKFAQFIERNLLDIHSPTGAEMLEVATSFQAKKGVNFASGTKLANGQTQLVYEETIQAKAGEKGTLNVPDEITIVIPVFDGSTVGDKITAKFRYQIDGGRLFMWFELVRAHKVLELATGDLLTKIQEGTKLVAYKGTAPSAR
ncbi:Uncharacterized conserved protein YfdQ, DUF2303 family [Paraburkholderia hospita]|nr:Uncharacterized conserved protein YfdQ, DUF2303 family [Paraburkholderia hospita]